MNPTLAKHCRSHLSRCISSLLVFVVVAIIGAKIFQELEGNQEREDAKAVADDEATINSIINEYVGNHPEDLARLNDALNVVRGYAYSKRAAPSIEELNWTFSGSVFFVFTIMTTIGYGTFAPTTAAGRAAVVWLGTILLGVGGVSIGAFSTAVDTVIDKIITRAGLGKGHKAAMGVLCCIVWSLVCAACFAANLGTDFGIGLYYGFVTFTTIGFGDFAILYKDDDKALVWFTLVTLVGLVLATTAIGQLVTFLTDHFTPAEDEPTEKEQTAPEAVNTVIHI